MIDRRSAVEVQSNLHEERLQYAMMGKNTVKQHDIVLTSKIESPDGALLHAHDVHATLKQWWLNNARELPWRFGHTSPWGVLVSEVMSQQTQMSRVVPYWQMWMQQWPDPQSLSQATAAEILTAWGKLGYPRRALRLQECARVITQDYHGILPTTYDELVALPGIGDYTASAVLSFAFGVRIAVVDTNIRRVLSRVFLGQESLGGSATKQERQLASDVLPHDINQVQHAACANHTEQSHHTAKSHRTEQTSNTTQANHAYQSEQTQRTQSSDHIAPWNKPSAIWNQAVMELGATVCTAKTPQCEQCPLQSYCAFYAAGLPGLGQQRTRPRQKFKGTDRQVRGIVLDALRKLPQGSVLTRSQVEQLWENQTQLGECLASLDNDGLIEILPQGDISFPSAQ
ncbi:adenine glycosylase [Galliscardovia ingluviei]|uniref:Adenine DNA glycosylase n=1 Tax=Galliscardovia ingluviei TaxID=1769422 RepID=A0A8J3AHX7_9BIFI|nr:A/G-specific adenine glycosylase [Galliscardovia ingluviei]GGI14099.1 adenine glycosylase [Galliscardovia ingluviei]